MESPFGERGSGDSNRGLIVAKTGLNVFVFNTLVDANTPEILRNLLLKFFIFSHQFRPNFPRLSHKSNVSKENLKTIQTITEYQSSHLMLISIILIKGEDLSGNLFI